jgi:hypothetical protein
MSCATWRMVLGVDMEQIVGIGGERLKGGLSPVPE